MLPWIMPPSLLGLLFTSLLLLSLPQSTHQSTDEKLFSNYKVMRTKAQGTATSTEAQNTVMSTEAQSNTVRSTEAQNTVMNTEAQTTVTSTEAQTTVTSTETQTTVTSTEAQTTVKSTEAQCTVMSTEATVEDVSTVTAPLRTACPEGSKIYGSYCYGLFHIPETWYAAELDCQNLPLGHLASLTNDAEASFVASMIAENRGSWVPIWIGLHNPLKNHRWRWSSNALLTYQAWDTNAPSSNSGFCVNLTQGSGFLRWNNAACEDKFSYICKFIAEKW